mmetsp:Transcript_25142/g.64314  ORF Transcript_25142/g.64314 Transcript_25142/m.64314 type:complete len:495 (-) Transcript_25142:244-1728(-)
MAHLGTVRHFDPLKGYGFIVPEVAIDMKDIDCSEAPPDAKLDSMKGIFVHSTGIRGDIGMVQSLEVGDVVRFDVAATARGFAAVNVVGENGENIQGKLHRVTLHGVCWGQIQYWNDAKGFGWIAAEIDKEGLLAQRVPDRILDLNGGMIYVQRNDLARYVRDLTTGMPVVFSIYWDEKGLGAANVNIGGGTPIDSDLLSQNLSDLTRVFAKIASLGREEKLQELQSTAPNVHLKLMIERGHIGTVIGQKGATVKRMIQESGAKRVAVEDMKNCVPEAQRMATLRAVDVHGTPSASAKAISLIAVTTAAENDEWTIRFMVPKPVFGWVVGKKLSVLEELQQKTGVTITTESSSEMPHLGTIELIICQGTVAEEDARNECLEILAARVGSVVAVALQPHIESPGNRGGGDAGKGKGEDGGKSGFKGGDKGDGGGFKGGKNDKSKGFKGDSGKGKYGGGGKGDYRNDYNQSKGGKDGGKKGGKSKGKGRNNRFDNDD